MMYTLNRRWYCLAYIRIPINTESIRVRCHPHDRRLLVALTAEDGKSMSEEIRDLIEAEYKRRHGSTIISPARERIGIPGRPPKGGRSDAEFEARLTKKD